MTIKKVCMILWYLLVFCYFGFCTFVASHDFFYPPNMYILTKRLFLRNVNAKLYIRFSLTTFIFFWQLNQWHLIQKLETCSQRKMCIKILVCMHTTSLLFSISLWYELFLYKEKWSKTKKKNTFLVGGTLGGLKNVASRGLTAVGSSGIAVDSLDTSLISVRSWGQYQKK